MKRFTLILACLAATVLSVAQTQMKVMTIEQDGKPDTKVIVANVDQITFADEDVYQITTIEDGGTIAGAEGYFFQSDEVVLTAVPDGENEFLYWQIGEDRFYGNPELSITMTSDVEVKAVFVDDPSMGYGFVDLGLSVLWATTNVGADTEEQAGSYFAWGETTPKTEFTWGNYELGTYDAEDPNKGMELTLSDDQNLSYQKDAATANWGGDWRMPTIDEWKELVDSKNTTWTKINEESKKGWLVTSKIEGFTDNSIFLPATGCYQEEGPKKLDVDGDYWASTQRRLTLSPAVTPKDSHYTTVGIAAADDFWFGMDQNTYKMGDGAQRYWGMAIRAVRPANR